MTLKRFSIRPGEKCIIAEDVVTTGVSSLETKRVICLLYTSRWFPLEQAKRNILTLARSGAHTVKFIDRRCV